MNFICFDTEDDSKELLQAGKSGFDKKVTQIAAITAEGKGYYNRGNVKDFLRWLKQQPEKYIYAHNLQYDLGNLFSRELDGLDMTLVGGRVIKAVWGNKIFVDSFNIWPMAAAKLGEAFKLEKLATESMATDKAYVMRDVEIIRQAMLFAWQFCQPLGIDNLPSTLGGLCVKVWKAFGGTNCHDSNELSRQAYYGGRVELFKVCNDETWRLNDKASVYAVFNKQATSDVLTFPTTETVCWTDINSLYPHVMRQRYPAEMEDFGTQLPEYGVARCRVKVPETALTVLPWRDADGRIFYPWGRFEGTWTIEELRAAEKRGAKIEKVFEAFGSNDYLEPYTTFVEKLYNARLRSQSDAEKLFFKLLMNNLYGRLGNGGTIGRTVWQTEKNKFDGVPFGEKVLVEYQMPLSEETNWSHAAHVTAYGRLALLDFIEKVGVERMIYCDTDSCIFDCPDKKIPFKVSSELGQMKLEGWEKCCVAFAPKMYRTGKKFKAKGVPRRLAETFVNTGRAEFDLPFKMREAIRFYDRQNTRRLSVWRKVVKENRQTYDRKKLVENRFYPCKKISVG